MKDVIIDLFGSYEPVLTDVYDASGELVGQAIASGVAGVDWAWIAGVVLFAIVLYGALRLLGVVCRG